jgi:heterotetrameric sarcosine oxidase gamma subunit
MPELPVSEPAVAAAPAVAADAVGARPPWPAPVARSPIAPAAPVTVVAGWQVSAVRAASPDLTLTDCTPLAKVALAARRAEVRGVRFGRAARDPAGTLVVGSGPGEWLLIGPPGQAPALAAGLEALVGPDAPDDGATWVDLTHGRALIRLTGDRAVGVLAKLAAIDLSDDRVPDGAALRTAVAAVATDVIRDDTGGARSYLLHCERSVGQYLFDAVLRAGAEFGIGVDGFRLPGPAVAG